MKDAALSVAERHEQRLVEPGSPVRGIRKTCGEHRQILTRTAQRRIKLVALMHPHRRKTARDRMARVANRDPERQTAPVAARGAGLLIRNERGILEVPHRPGLLVAPAPAADPDHHVERAPARKCVVGGVHGHEAAAVSHVLLERRLQR